jgi:dynein heavy chain, axonemal
MEGKQGLRVVRLSDASYLRNLENSIRAGSPVLIEDVGDTIDSALDPLLLRQTFKQGGRLLIRLGDTDIDYEPSFR